MENVMERETVKENVMKGVTKQEREVMALVQERVPEIHIELMEIEKNNGCRKRGFQMYGEDASQRMIVYQEMLIRACGSSYTAREAADYLCQLMEQEKPLPFCQEMLCNWEKAKSNVYKKVVNYEKNADRLPFYVHRRFLDLAELYYVRLKINENGWGSAEISLAILEAWGISEEELEQQAEKNLKADGYGIRPMEEILSEMSGCCSGLHLIQNQRMEYGAAVMTSPGQMKAFLEELGSSGYVFPCSIHELLVLPDDGKQDVKDLRELVREVNQTSVSPEEFLSDQVYYCHVETGKTELCQED